MLYSSTGKIFSCFKYSGSTASKVSENLMLHKVAKTQSNYCTEANSGPNLDNVSSLILSHNICIKSEIQEQEKLWYVAVW